MSTARQGSGSTPQLGGRVKPGDDRGREYEKHSAGVSSPAMSRTRLQPLLRFRAVQRLALALQGARRVSFGGAPYDDITAELQALGVQMGDFTSDLGGFADYQQRADYSRWPHYFDAGRHPLACEKQLEHWVSLELAAPQRGERLVDIASDPSPFPDIARELYALETFRQDRTYPAGIHGDRIGGDAVTLPLEAASVDILTLHCSFEHFEGDRDILFFREAARVLRPGGRLVILPFYTSREASVLTDPASWHRGWPRFQPGWTVSVKPGWGEMHGRMYSAAEVKRRVFGDHGLEIQLLRIQNGIRAQPTTYVRYALVGRKRAAGPDQRA